MPFKSYSPAQEDGFALYFCKQTLFILSSAGTVSIQWLELLPYGLRLKNLSSWETKVEVGSFLMHEFFEVPVENTGNTEKL